MSRVKSKKAKPIRLGRVLVVEDDAILGLSIEAALIDAGVGQVVICHSTAMTMDALEEGPVDAIVLDVHLSDRSDGWAVAELAELLGPKPPRIVFSTGSPEEIPPEIAEMGPILEKPYDPAVLVQILASDQKTGFFDRLRSAIS